MHEERLTGPHAGHVQHLGGSGGGQQQVRGQLEGDARRLGEHILRGDGQLGGPATAHPERERLVTDRAATGGELGVRADRRHHTGDLVPNGPREVVGVVALGDVLGVGRVEPRCPHHHVHLARPGRPHVDVHQLEHLEPSGTMGDPLAGHGVGTVARPRPFPSGSGSASERREPEHVRRRRFLARHEPEAREESVGGVVPREDLAHPQLAPPEDPPPVGVAVSGPGQVDVRVAREGTQP